MRLAVLLDYESRMQLESRRNLAKTVRTLVGRRCKLSFFLVRQQGKIENRCDRSSLIMTEELPLRFRQWAEEGVDGVFDLTDSISLSVTKKNQISTVASLLGLFYYSPGLMVLSNKALELKEAALVISICGSGKTVGKTTLAAGLADILAKGGQPVCIISIERSPLRISRRINYASDYHVLKTSTRTVMHLLKMGESLPFVAHVGRDNDATLRELRGIVIIDNSGASIAPIKADLILSLGDNRELMRTFHEAIEGVLGGAVYRIRIDGNRALRGIQAVPAEPVLPDACPRDLGGQPCLLLTRFTLRNCKAFLSALRMRKVGNITRQRYATTDGGLQALGEWFDDKREGIAFIDSGSILNRVPGELRGRTFVLSFHTDEEAVKRLLRRCLPPGRKVDLGNLLEKKP